MNKKCMTMYNSKSKTDNRRCGVLRKFQTPVALLPGSAECDEEMKMQKTPSYYCEDLQQSNDALNYMMFNGKYSNQDNCRPNLGIVGGNNVSQYCGNLVDLETDLRISSNSINKMFLDPSSNSKKSNKLINLPSCLSEDNELRKIGYGNENIINYRKSNMCNRN